GNDLDTYNILLQLIKDHEAPNNNSYFCNSIDPTQFISDVTTPIQLQVGTADTEVPPSFSSSLKDILENHGKTVDYHKYEGADHNLLPNQYEAIKRAISFF